MEQRSVEIRRFITTTVIFVCKINYRFIPIITLFVSPCLKLRGIERGGTGSV